MKKKKRCLYCGEWFQPDPKTAKHQKACGKESCKVKRKRQAQEHWLKANPGYYKNRGIKVRKWAKEYPNYWKHYRAVHPEYTKRNRKMQYARDQKQRKNLAKQDAIRKKALEMLEKLRSLPYPLLAKQDTITQKIQGVLDILIWEKNLAKQNDIARLSG